MWIFKNIINGEIIEDRKEIKIFSKLLKTAKNACPTPDESGYFVRASAMTVGGHYVFGSNHEYATTNGIHSEESLIVRVLEKFGADDMIRFIGFLGEPGEIVRPCGNCREIIKKYAFVDNGYIITGSPKGGLATVIPLKEFFFEKFNYTDRNPSSIEKIAIKEALRALNFSFDAYVSFDLHHLYGAAIITYNGNIFSGGFLGFSDYHPCFPIMSAINNLVFSKKTNRFDVYELVIVYPFTAGKPVSVNYKDRQHFLDFSEVIMKNKGKRADKPIKIKIFALNKCGQVCCSWKTNSREWLPFPFSAQEFGMSDTIQKMVEKLQ